MGRNITHKRKHCLGAPQSCFTCPYEKCIGNFPATPAETRYDHCGTVRYVGSGDFGENKHFANQFGKFRNGNKLLI